jgi:hypothetical protein
MPKRTKPPHEPTKVTRELVSLHATMGTTQEIISKILEIDLKTLRKYYRNELDQSLSKANATIGGALFNKAKAGDTGAMIFWLKTRARWSTVEQVDHVSSDGSMTPEKVERVVVKVGDITDTDR